MKYREWLEENRDKAANIVEFKSYGGNIKREDGTVDTDKIMDMSIMMVMNGSEQEITMILC